MLDISMSITRAKAGDEDALADLLHQNQGLIHKIAYQFQRIYQGPTEIDDLIQDGSLGLLHAVKKYNPQFSAKFSTYAYYWIRHAIWRSGLKEHDLFRLGVRESTDLMTYRNTERVMKDTLCRQPTLKEIATFSKMSLKRVKRAQEFARASKVSYDEICEVEDIGEPFQSEEASDLLADILADLPESERSVIVARFGLDGEQAKTPRQVGQALGLTVRQVNEIEKRAMDQLRHWMNTP